MEKITESVAGNEFRRRQEILAKLAVTATPEEEFNAHPLVVMYRFLTS